MKKELKEYPDTMLVGITKGWGCGYVTATKDEPLYKMAKLKQLEEEGNGFGFFMFQPEGLDQEITLCEIDEDGIKIGFDTAHIYNSEANDKEYVERETQRMYDVCNYTDEDVSYEAYRVVEKLKYQVNKILTNN